MSRRPRRAGSRERSGAGTVPSAAAAGSTSVASESAQACELWSSARVRPIAAPWQRCVDALACSPGGGSSRSGFDESGAATAAVPSDWQSRHAALMARDAGLTRRSRRKPVATARETAGVNGRRSDAIGVALRGLGRITFGQSVWVSLGSDVVVLAGTRVDDVHRRAHPVLPCLAIVEFDVGERIGVGERRLKDRSAAADQVRAEVVERVVAAATRDDVRGTPQSPVVKGGVGLRMVNLKVGQVGLRQFRQPLVKFFRGFSARDDLHKPSTSMAAL